jgi:preprotein translocase subunit SecG
MLLTILNVFYVLVAIAMSILILLQRGAGAQAGSGFGSGASATVFGARGASTFLSRSTGVLAGVFFLLSVLIGIYVHPVGPSASDLGVMGAASAPAKAPVAAPVTGDVPKAPAAANTSDKPAPTPVPAAAPEKKTGDGGPKPDAPKKN